MIKFETPKIHVHKNGKLFGFGVSPSDDWRVIFVVMLSLAIFVVLFGMYMFIKIEQGDIFVVQKEVSETDHTLNQNLLIKTIQFYQDRAMKFEAIKANKEEIVDPSI